MELKWIQGEYSLCKLRGADEIFFLGNCVFYAKTEDEISLVCETSFAPQSAPVRKDGWRMFRVTGQLDFSLTGILSRLSATLAQNGVGIFAVSTFDTDYIMVKAEQAGTAQDALERAGYKFVL